MNRQYIRGAILLAVIFILQSLRLVFPLPPLISLFVFGSLINACFLLGVEVTNFKATIVLAILTPLIAFLQQAIPMPIVFLPLGILSNLVYMGIYFIFIKHKYVGIMIASIGKIVLMYYLTPILLKVIELPDFLVNMFLQLLTWPQAVTGILGGYICLFLLKRIFEEKILVK